MSRIAAMVAELRRRRVFRALLAWGVVSFAVLQVVEPMMHGLDLPPWTLKAAIWILAAGFPVTSVLAWVFDLGPGGVTRTPILPATDAGCAMPSRRRRAAAMAGLVVTSAVVGAGLAVLALRVLDRQPAAGPDGRITVAVADFANETRDPDLDALSGLLITSLEQSQRLRVLTRGRMFEVLDQLGQGNARRIDEKLARQLGRKAGVGTLLLATVRRFEEVYSVEMQALDPAREEYLFTVKAEGRGKQSVPGLVDELSAKARLRFLEGRTEMASSSLKVAEKVTADLEAYSHYFAGIACLDRESFFRASRCAPDFERAIARDPGFTLAHAYLANLRAFFNLPGFETSQAAALRGLDRVPERDRPRVRFLARAGDPRTTQIASGREALAASPDDRYLAFRLGQHVAYEGDPPGAIPILRQVADSHPTAQSTAYYLLVAALGVSGRRAELQELVDRLSSGPQSHVTLEALLVARGFLGDAPGVLDAGRRFAESAPPERRAEAEERFRIARLKLGDPAVEGELTTLAKANPDHHITLAFLQTLQGRRKEAARSVETWTRATHGPGTRVNALLLPWNTAEFAAADLLLGSGDTATAWGHAERIPDRAWMARTSERGALATGFAYARDPGHAAVFIPDLEGRVFLGRLHGAVALWRSGDMAGARAQLEDLSSRTIISWRPAPLPPAFLLGELASEMGDDRRAVTALRSFRSCWLAWSAPHMAWVYPKSLYLSARSHERLGQLREARDDIEALLGWWKRADPDLPLLADAKALKRRLDSQSRVPGDEP